MTKRSDNSGATLIELLISMTLMATLTAGGLAAYARASSSYHTASVEQRLRQRAQYVLATLEPELQMAGYFGGAAAPTLIEKDLPATVRDCGSEWLTRLDVPLETAANLPRGCDPRGGLMPGTQALILRRVSAQRMPAHAGRAQWLVQTGAMRSGSVLWDGVLPAGTPASPELRDLIVRAYYISRTADGDPATPALRMKSLTEVAGKPAFVDTEVMSGVEDLQFALQPAAGAPRAIRVTLQLRSDAGDLRASEPPRHLSITRHFTLRNPVPAP
ncbi:MAG TPA: prepilin-type N-terminal cleavage/methylation domain-containing protein [Steroidobacteraceae bacterium]|nr:prepilin-type N-terminal cleavage/methylation domain-containing protein [Steroidobacteraceae bacterium]